MRKLAVIVGVSTAIVAGVFAATSSNDDMVESSATTTTTTTSVPSTTTTTAAPSTTTSSPPSTIGATVAEEGELAAPELTMDVEVAQLGETFIRFRFRSSEPTPYTTTVTDLEGKVVGRSDGVLAAGQVFTERVEGLEPGTVYSAQATLIGPPAVQSSEVLFRTTGATADPEADAQTAQVEMQNLRVSELGPFHVQFDYLSNVCANGSFRVVNQETGVEVGRNNGHPNGCVGKHLGVPGRWSPPLEPSTTYVVVVTLEANGEFRGRQYGNMVTESLIVTTPPRDIPEDPANRQVAPVAFTSVAQMETDESTVRIDFATNVCTNASFVVREVGGDEVGRHDGFPRGCASEHSAIPGLWTPPLEPDTRYTVVITAEADGPGSGEGNTATETITVKTAATPVPNANPPQPVSIESIEHVVEGDTATLTIATNICATATVVAYEEAGELLGETTATDTCDERIVVTGVPVVGEANTVVVVSVEAEELAPGTPNRTSTSVVLNQ